MAADPPTWRGALVAVGVIAALTAAPALAYWYEQWDEVRRTVPGTTVVAECSERGCVGRFTSDDGLVELDPVRVVGVAAPASVRMWLSPREAVPALDPPRMWPTSGLVLLAALGPQVFLGVHLIGYARARRRPDRPWPPARWVQTLTDQVFLVILLGGLLALCSGAGAAGTSLVRTPGQVTGIECPESGCVGQFSSDDGATRQPVDIPAPPSRDGPVRAWLEDGTVTFHPPADPVLFLLLPLVGVVAFEIWMIVDNRPRRRARSTPAT